MKLRLLVPFVLLLTAVSTFSQTENVKYTQMTEKEKQKFIENKSNEFLSLFRTLGNYQIDAEGVIRVKTEVDLYLKKDSTDRESPIECFGDDLPTILKRGKQYAPDIKSAFTGKELPAQVGLYIAMIESRFCPCLQFPTGETLGMFQFTVMTGSTYGIKTFDGATSQNPDDRCKVKSAASGAAEYLKKMADTDFGNNALGIPFAISAYNSDEAVTKTLISLSNLKKKDTFTYWEMRKFSFSTVGKNEWQKNAVRQFQAEGFRYFPTFLAGMIIGENPKTFGIEMNPLSQN